MYGGALYGESLYSGSALVDVGTDPAAPSYPTRSTTVPYSIEVRTKGGSFLEYIPAFDRGLWTEEQNKAGTIDLDVPMLDAAAQYMTKPNKLYLFDHRHFLEQVFWIQNDESADGSNAIQTIEGSSLIVQLRDEPVEDYVSPTPDPIVRDVLIALLALQKRTNKIRLGVIHSSIGNATISLDIVGRSVLYGITKIHEIVGGSYWVDQFGRLNWKPVRGSAKGVRLEFGFNAANVSRRRTTDRQVTRLRMLGKQKTDGTGDRLSVVDAGEATEWLTDAAAVATYDKISRQIVDNEIDDADTLLAAATLYLENFKNPVTSYEVDAADMSQADQTGRDEWFQLQVGDSTPLIDLRMTPNVDATFKVNQRKIDLKNPLAGSSLVMATRQDTLDTLLSRMRREQKTLATNGVGSVINIQEILQRIVDGDTNILNTFVEILNKTIRNAMETRSPHVTDTDMAAVNARTGLASTEDKYVERYFEGMTAHTQDNGWVWSWVGNPSDDGSPGAWVKHITIHNAANKAALPAGTDGDLAYTADHQVHEYVDGVWVRKIYLETHANLTGLKGLLPSGNEKFRAWLGGVTDNDHVYIYSDDGGFTTKLVPISHAEQHS